MRSKRRGRRRISKRRRRRRRWQSFDRNRSMNHVAVLLQSSVFGARASVIALSLFVNSRFLLRDAKGAFALSSMKAVRGRSRGEKSQIRQLTIDEQCRIENVMRKEKGSATDALWRINKEWRKAE